MADGIDLEALRHRLKLRKDTGDTTLFENRDDVACPVCDDPFDEVLATAERTRTVDPGRELRLCLLRESDRLVVFTHA